MTTRRKFLRTLGVASGPVMLLATLTKGSWVRRHEDPPKPAKCTRKKWHDGPCNGWPCYKVVHRALPISTVHDSFLYDLTDFKDLRGDDFTVVADFDTALPVLEVRRLI